MDSSELSLHALVCGTGMMDTCDMKTRSSRKNPGGGGVEFALGMGAGAAAMGAIWLVSKVVSKPTLPPPAAWRPVVWES